MRVSSSECDNPVVEGMPVCPAEFVLHPALKICRAGSTGRPTVKPSHVSSKLRLKCNVCGASPWEIHLPCSRGKNARVTYTLKLTNKGLDRRPKRNNKLERPQHAQFHHQPTQQRSISTSCESWHCCAGTEWDPLRTPSPVDTPLQSSS
jgi:hypothetical protein